MSLDKSIVIAIDGPTAGGKGTLAKKLAQALDFALLDTGLLYRAVGVALRAAGYTPDNTEQATLQAQRLKAEDIQDDDELRSAEAGQLASQVSAIPAVRQALLEFQRNFAAHPPGGAAGAVLDGRDIGTVVCPDALVKLYITATAEARAQRRHKELLSRNLSLGQSKSYDDVLADIKARDDRDMNRAVAPLKPAVDAIILDTTLMDPDKAFDVALALVRERMLVKAET
jgi:cytidylate kinase